VQVVEPTEQFMIVPLDECLVVRHIDVLARRLALGASRDIEGRQHELHGVIEHAFVIVQTAHFLLVTNVEKQQAMLQFKLDQVVRINPLQANLVDLELVFDEVSQGKVDAAQHSFV